MTVEIFGHKFGKRQSPPPSPEAADDSAEKEAVIRLEPCDLVKEWKLAQEKGNQEGLDEVRERVEALLYLLFMSKDEAAREELKSNFGEEIDRLEKSFKLACTRVDKSWRIQRQHKPSELIESLMDSLKYSLATDPNPPIPLGALDRIPGLKDKILEAPKDWGIRQEGEVGLIKLQAEHIMRAVDEFIKSQLKRVEDNKKEDELLENERGLLEEIMRGADWETPLARENEFTLGMISNLLKSLSQLEQEERMDADKRQKIHEVVVENLEKVKKIRQGKDSPEEKDRKTNDILKNISKSLWEGSKNIVGILGAGALLWGAAFAFYLPLLIIKHAEDRVKPYT